ncbi:DUF5753 domain-containing protein [Kitasatospora sp. NPDC048239]|uniref:DUF5753 domain-containing protein n=1 Tax=Kitasatospora sp. NPDC048239 TaxID=3364046 RepID=UPI00371B0B14
MKDAGATIGMGGPQLSHIEAARTGLDPARLATLLSTYGCTDETYVAILQELGASDGKGWWTEFKGKVPSLALDLAELENQATLVDNYETLYLPGLFQLPAYAEAIHGDAYNNGKWGIADAVRFRVARQQILDERRMFRFIIHEAALRMRFPGDAVMRAQLMHLLDMAERPNITIQVFPFTAAKRPPHSGSFVLCNPGCTDLSTIVVDAPGRTEHYGDPESIAAYGQKFEELGHLALPAVDKGDALRGMPARDSWGILHHLLYLLQA